jgi:ATP-dependent Clp protease ATP-binding subunit ClpA
MDYATLTDNNGKKADFRHVILLMTTNAGAREMAASNIGFGGTGKDLNLGKGKKAIEKLFTPEFRNRLDEIVMFNSLSIDIMEQIADKFMAEISGQLSAKKVAIELSAKARNWLARYGFKPEYGARPLARLIQTQIKDVISDEILFGSLLKGGRVKIDCAKDGDSAPDPDSNKRHFVFSFE